MTDGSRHSPAWRVSTADYLDRRGPPLDGPPSLASVYMEARDGTRLAVDIHLPPGRRPRG